MFKKLACSSALALAFLVMPTAKMFAQASPMPSAVTGGDPQPTGHVTIVLLTIIASLAVL